MWQFKDLYGGNDETAPFRDSVAVGSAVVCMVEDEASRVVWSGHRDGRIRCWKMDFSLDRFREVLSWVAHNGPVLSMVGTSYGQSLFFLSICFFTARFSLFFNFSDVYGLFENTYVINSAQFTRFMNLRGDRNMCRHGCSFFLSFFCNYSCYILCFGNQISFPISELAYSFFIVQKVVCYF